MNKFIPYFEIAAFIGSIMAWPYIRESKHMRLFPALLLIIATTEIWLIFFNESFSYYNTSIYNVQVPLQHLLYLLILYFAFESRSLKDLMMIFCVLLAVLVPLTAIYLTEHNRINSTAYCAGSILIITGILLKFYEMLKKPTDFNFLKSPFFYMLFAFLLFNVGTLPYFTMGNWLYYSLKRDDILTVLINVMSVFNYLLYTVYTLAFVWMILRKQSY